MLGALRGLPIWPQDCVYCVSVSKVLNEGGECGQISVHRPELLLCYSHLLYQPIRHLHHHCHVLMDRASQWTK